MLLVNTSAVYCKIAKYFEERSEGGNFSPSFSLRGAMERSWKELLERSSKRSSLLKKWRLYKSAVLGAHQVTSNDTRCESKGQGEMVCPKSHPGTTRKDPQVRVSRPSLDSHPWKYMMRNVSCPMAMGQTCHSFVRRVSQSDGRGRWQMPESHNDSSSRCVCRRPSPSLSLPLTRLMMRNWTNWFPPPPSTQTKGSSREQRLIIVGTRFGDKYLLPRTVSASDWFRKILSSPNLTQKRELLLMRTSRRQHIIDWTDTDLPLPYSLPSLPYGPACTF